jgi:MerR family mercuric resistance operon transcriptional regulator
MEATMEVLTIGQLAKNAGVNVETIRYYERRQLIPEPPRRESGYRQYTADFVVRIQFIKRAQELGFSLNEIAELLALRIDSETTCSEVRKHAEAKIANIEGKIQTLQSMKQALVELVQVCNENGTTGECPILEALEGKGII